MGTPNFADNLPSREHTHPGPEFAYILDGALTLEPEGQALKTYKTGEVFHNAAKIVHDAKNASATAPSKVLVFLLAEKGQPPRYPSAVTVSGLATVAHLRGILAVSPTPLSTPCWSL